jgi:hypothetical protein
VRFDPRDISRVYLERAGAPPLVVPLRDRQLPALSLWEWNAFSRARREVVERVDAQHVCTALGRPPIAPTTLAPVTLKARRRAARAAAWREVQAIAALPVPDVALEPTMVSDDAAGPFAWEVLE